MKSLLEPLNILVARRYPACFRAEVVRCIRLRQIVQRFLLLTVLCVFCLTTACCPNRFRYSLSIRDAATQNPIPGARVTIPTILSIRNHAWKSNTVGDVNIETCGNAPTWLYINIGDHVYSVRDLPSDYLANRDYEMGPDGGVMPIIDVRGVRK